MLVKINSRGSGGGRGPTEYLTGDFGTVDGKMPTAAQRAEGIGLRSVKPVVLRGDVEQTRELIDSLSFKQKYTSGVLSFEEPNITPAAKAEIMESWESAIFPGMEKDQYQILWVEHRDKGRLELNFLIPNVELDSGKRLQPYFDKADRNRVDAWQTITNDEHKLSDPKEPERARNPELATPSDLPKSTAKATEQITAGLLQMEPRNRSEVISGLQSVGFEVAREAKSSISIKSPDGGRNIRLTGRIYERDFQAGADGRELEAERQRAARTYAEGRESRISEAQQRYKIGIDKRTEYLHDRYKRDEPPALAIRDIERASVGRRVPDRLRPDGLPLPERKLDDNEDLRPSRTGGEVVPVRAASQIPRVGYVQSTGVDHDGAGTNPIEFAQGVGRRARKRTSENGRHAEADRPAGRILEASRSLAGAVDQITERLGRAVDQLAFKVEEVARELRQAMQPTADRVRKFMQDNPVEKSPSKGGPSMGR